VKETGMEDKFALVATDQRIIRISRSKEMLQQSDLPLYPGGSIVPVEVIDHGPTQRITGAMKLVYEPARGRVIMSWPTVPKTQAELDADAKNRERAAIGDPHELMMQLFDAMEAGTLPKVPGFYEKIAAAKAGAAT
jgi:hypothetical protein